MAFANIAGRAGFVIDLDKSAIDKGLPQVEAQFTRSMANVEATTRKSSVSVANTFAPLLAKTRAMGAEADVLAKRAAGLGTGLEATAAGAKTLDTGMGQLIARGALLTVGINTAYQASRHLKEGLEQTGAEAFTTEGKLRNFGSALLSGDIVGGIQALSALPKTLDEAGISAVEAANKYELFKTLAGEDGPIGQLARQAVELVDNTRAAAAAQDALADAVSRVGAAYRPAAGDAVRFTGSRDSVSPGAVDQINTELEANRAARSGRIARPIGPTARNAAAQTIAQARGDLDELLRLQVAERDRLTKAYANATGNRQQRIALNQELANAQAAVISTNKQIAANAEAEAASAKSAADARRAAAERALRDRFGTEEQRLRNQYELALGTPSQRDDRRRASALSTFLGRRSRDERLDPGERADFRSRQIAFIRQRVKDRIDETDDERKAQELILKNDVKAAELSEKNKKDDLRALRRLRDFYKREQREADTVLERQEARSDRIDTQKKINEILRGKTTAEGDVGGVLRDFMNFQHEFLTGMISNFLGGTGTGNALQTHALEQFTLQGNRERSEQTGLLRSIASRGGRRELDESLMA